MKEEGCNYSLPPSSLLVSYKLYVMHFDALRVFVLFGGVFSAAAVFFAAFTGICLSEAGLSGDLKVQPLLEHRPPITSDPHLQNSANYITPPSIV